MSLPIGVIDNKIKFTIIPNVFKYLDGLKNVEILLQKALDHALVDFMMVSSVFKKYNQFLNPGIEDADAKRVSSSVRELQYMDIFAQKVDHVIRLNKRILSLQEQLNEEHAQNQDHAGFIFLLNYFQMIAASEEFFYNAVHLKNNLVELHDHIVSVTSLKFDEQNYFKNLDTIKVLLDEVRDELKEIQSLRNLEAPYELTKMEDDLKILADFYTMASERFVYSWVLKNKNATGEKLLEQYKREGYEDIEEEIELF